MIDMVMGCSHSVTETNKYLFEKIKYILFCDALIKVAIVIIDTKM